MLKSFILRYFYMIVLKIKVKNFSTFFGDCAIVA